MVVEWRDVGLALLVVLLVVIGKVYGAHAQDETPEIDYCKRPNGDIIMVGEGSPCPNGSYPL